MLARFFSGGGARRRGAGRATALCVLLVVAGTCTALAGDGEAIAFVNGVPVSRDEMIDLLMESHGLSALQQLIMLRLAKQETHKLGIKVTQADVDREFENALDRIAREADDDPKTLKPEDRQRILDRLLEDKGISLAEFKLGMERNAHLRKAVEHTLVITEETLRQEFARTYGERAQVRKIVINLKNTELVNEVQTLLQDGASFADVARRMSQDPETAQRGGEIRPFTFDDPDVDPVVREKAFLMQPGEISSPIRVGSHFEILQLQRRLPPEDVRFEEVRDEVERRLRDRIVPAEMSRIANDAFQKAEVRVLDRSLRKHYEELLQRNAGTTP
ncbi:MAG: peptidylprolyl isomerase [Phycisphaerae bacterium]|nr:peptidylprolyl isomerase [Phycisphaerae bacterium]